jgi:3-(methylsulfanyl)propanoyl-CoA dehydrogenase
MTYAAPLDDMRFVLNRLAGLPEIATLPGFEDADPEVVEAILIEAGRFAGEVLAPLNSTGDRQGCRWLDGKVATPDGFPAAYQQFIEGGWHSMPASTDIGGQGMPALVSSAVAEMWKSANLAFSLCQMLTMGAVEALVNHASDTLKQRFLPKMVAGEWTGTMNLTEPQAGSDLSAVRTRAEPDGDHYRLSGSKIFITWGESQRTSFISSSPDCRTRPRAHAGFRYSSHRNSWSIRMAASARATTLFAPPSNTSSAYMARPRR